MRESRPVELPSLALAFHELRAPLGFVATAARLIADDAEEPLLKQQCSMIERAATRMMMTAQTVLSAANNSPVSECATSDIVASVAKVTEDMRWMGLNIEGKFSGEIRGVRGSAHDLECLLASLLLNAGDHGDLAHPVTVNVHQEGGSVAVSIINRCAAVARHRGQGLGSVVVARLAERLGASVTYHEDDGWFTSVVELEAQREVVAAEAAFF
jgi:signal transduction histidine kinase